MTNNLKALIAAFASFVMSSPMAYAADDYFQAGVDLFKRGNYSDAANYLERASSQDSERPLIPWYQAQCYMKLNNNSRALSSANKLVTIAGYNSQAYSLRGRIEYLMRDNKSALDDCNQALTLDGTNAQAYETRSSLERAAGQYSDSVIDYNRARALGARQGIIPENRALIQADSFRFSRRPPGFMQGGNLKPNDRFMGNLDLLAGNYKKAIEEFNKALDANGRDAESLKGRSAAKEKSADFRGAADDFGMFMDLVGSNPLLIIQRGDLYLKGNDTARAMNDYTRAIHINLRCAPGYLGRANCYLKMRQYDSALADTSLALSVDPKLLDAYQVRANIYVAQGQTQKAIDELTYLLRMQPKNADLCKKVGDFYYKLGKTAQALDFYTNALDLNPRDYDTTLARARIYEASKQYTPALRDYAQLTNINSSSADGSLGAARCNLKLGKNTAVLDWANDALRIDRTSGEAYALRADALIAMKKTDEASKDLERAIRYNPDNAVLYGKRAELLDLLGDYAGAAQLYGQALMRKADQSKWLAARGWDFIRVKQWSDAADTLTKAIGLDSKNGDLFALRSLANEKLGKRPQSVKDAEMARDLGSDLDITQFDDHETKPPPSQTDQ